MKVLHFIQTNKIFLQKASFNEKQTQPMRILRWWNGSRPAIVQLGEALGTKQLSPYQWLTVINDHDQSAYSQGFDDSTDASETCQGI